MKIQFCNKIIPFAKAKADLGQLLTPDAENLRYGQRYRQNIPIFGISNGNEILGTIKGTFILEREKCILCKSCNTHFRPSTTYIKTRQGEQDLQTKLCRRGFGSS